MKLLRKVIAGSKILFSGITGAKLPIAARINLTNKCINRCKYCNVWNTFSKEMSTRQVISLLDELKKAGVENISFSGGEPLLRKDINQILTYCKKIDMSTSMNTTGFMLEKKIGKMNIGLIKFSLDGNKEAHEPVRGKGTYSITLDAVATAYRGGKKFSFCTTLTKSSTTIENVNYMVDLAKKYDTFVAFQPLKTMYKGAKKIDTIAPGKKQIDIVLNEIVKLKKMNPENIRNSVYGLKHIMKWPSYEKLPCYAGKLFVIIQPNGDLVPCDRMDKPYKKIHNVIKQGFKKSYLDLEKINCSGCGFCAALEINYLANFKIGVIQEINEVVR